MSGSAGEIRLDGPILDIMLLNKQGYCCSQILVKLVLKSLGRENPDLVRSMASLCYGVAYTGETCGALTGGICALSLSLGSGELADQLLPSKLSELVSWFKEVATTHYGGVTCDQILAVSPDKRACSRLVAATLEKVHELSYMSSHTSSKGCLQ